MEFTESFPICQNSSNSGQILLSPSSHELAISEFYPADRRIGSIAEEVLPAWSVRIMECESLCTLREFYLKLPLDLISGKDNITAAKASDSIRSSKRQFVTGKPSQSQLSNNSTTVTSPQIGSGLLMKWSPDGRFLAAWPQDTSIIFILCPQSTGPSVNEPLLRIQELSAVGISSFKWTPDSSGILVNLQYGMGIKFWRLDCKYPVHLFPYPKSIEKDEGMVFSEDGQHLAILHRRDAVDHIAVYKRNDQNEDWNVLRVRLELNLLFINAITHSHFLFIYFFSGWMSLKMLIWTELVLHVVQVNLNSIKFPKFTHGNQFLK